jgi:hypothetical protein
MMQGKATVGKAAKKGLRGRSRPEMAAAKGIEAKVLGKGGAERE